MTLKFTSVWYWENDSNIGDPEPYSEIASSVHAGGARPTNGPDQWSLLLPEPGYYDVQIRVEVIGLKYNDMVTKHPAWPFGVNLYIDGYDPQWDPMIGLNDGATFHGVGVGRRGVASFRRDLVSDGTTTLYSYLDTPSWMTTSSGTSATFFIAMYTEFSCWEHDT